MTCLGWHANCNTRVLVKTFTVPNLTNTRLEKDHGIIFKND